MLNQIRKILKTFGPGLIIASVVLGPGSITVASRVGSEYGYVFLWVIVLAAVFMITYTSMGARFGVVSSDSILQTIALHYGRWFAIAIGISAFLSTSSFQFGNTLGIGIGMEGITGIDERVWPLIFTPLGIVLIFWAKNLYKVLENMMKLLVMIMILAFFINLILTKPEISSVARGVVPTKFSRDSLGVMAAMMATSFSLAAALYQSYLAQDKGWHVKNLKSSLRDTYIGIGILALISATILITSATALFPEGIMVNSAADMALQMEALFGSSAKVIFSIGLCAAAFSSMMVNSVIGGGLLADGLGMGRSMNDRSTKIFIIAILLIGMIVALFFRGNAIYALIMAQASSILAVPLIAVGLLLILNNKKVMGRYRNNLLQNIIAVAGFIVVCLMVYFMYQNLAAYLGTIVG
jgi:NRAMP (natural resistance-associated macrophage protein)-like metal ion transporter